jgi:heme/copper-type cytochrome/quinol oxidase subunit 3
VTTLDTRTEQAIRRPPRAAPERPVGHTTGWWGMVLFICTESMTFAAFLASYFYLRFDHGGPWPPAADKPPHLLFPSVGTFVLVLSCVTMALAVRAAPKGRRAALGLTLLVTLLAGCVFVAFQCVDYTQEMPSSTPTKDAYGSLMFMLTGLHVVHVLLGLGMLVVLVASTLLGRIGPTRPEPVAIVSLYWYFLAVLAVCIYGTVYLTPYLS